MHRTLNTIYIENQERGGEGPRVVAFICRAAVRFFLFVFFSIDTNDQKGEARQSEPDNEHIITHLWAIDLWSGARSRRRAQSKLFLLYILMGFLSRFCSNCWIDIVTFFGLGESSPGGQFNRLLDIIILRMQEGVRCLLINSMNNIYSKLNRFSFYAQRIHIWFDDLQNIIHG